MYFLIQGRAKDGSYDSFEWLIKSTSKEKAIKDAKKDLTDNDVIESVEELSVEQCIERENKDIKREIERYYLVNHYNYEKLSINEYNKIKEDFKSSKENYYEAITEATKSLKILRRLSRLTDIEKMTVKELRQGLNNLLKAKNEEEFTNALQCIIKKNSKKENMK